MTSCLDQIGPQEFGRIISELETITEKLAPERFLIYLERLKFYDATDLRQAIKIIMDRWDFRGFPPLAKILEALDSIQKKSSAASLEELMQRYPCPKCHFGYVEARSIWMGMIYEAIVFCDCQAGAFRRKQLLKIEDRAGRRKTEEATVFQIRLANHADWTWVIPESVIRASLGPRPGERVKTGALPMPIKLDFQLPTDGPADEDEEIPF